MGVGAEQKDKFGKSGEKGREVLEGLEGSFSLLHQVLLFLSRRVLG